MKTCILSLLLVLFAHTAASQTPSVLKDFDLNTKTFDLLIFNKNKSLGGEYEFYLDQDIKIWQYDEFDRIKEKITRFRDPYSIEKGYYPDGKLYYGVKQFYNFDVGKMNFYDEEGEIIQTNDYEYLYNFSVDDLVKKMQQEYGIDITDLKFGQKVNKVFTSPENNNKPEYSVTQEYLKKDSLSWEGGLLDCRKYIIDGSTGKTKKIEERVFMSSKYVSIGKYDGYKEFIYRFYERDGRGNVEKIIERRMKGSYDFYTTFREVLEENVIYESPSKKEKALGNHSKGNFPKSLFSEKERVPVSFLTQERHNSIRKKNTEDWAKGLSKRNDQTYNKQWLNLNNNV